MVGNQLSVIFKKLSFKYLLYLLLKKYLTNQLIENLKDS